MSPAPFRLGGKCRKGHLLTEDNTYTEGTRLRCKECRAGWKPAKAPVPRTHCPQGHAYDSENTYVDPQGYRQCRTCRKDRVYASRAPGPGQGAHNLAKTHCPAGHPYSEENTYRNPQGRRMCKTCSRANGAAQRIKSHGVSSEMFAALLDNQDGSCKICGTEINERSGQCIDHDHGCCPGVFSCGKCVRGILCKDCNTAIGFMRDDPERLRAAAAYLDNYMRT